MQIAQCALFMRGNRVRCATLPNPIGWVVQLGWDFIGEQGVYNASWDFWYCFPVVKQCTFDVGGYVHYLGNCNVAFNIVCDAAL